jgi:hypothetical protein
MAALGKLQGQRAPTVSPGHFQIQERSQIRESFPNSGTFNASKFRNVPEFGTTYFFRILNINLKYKLGYQNQLSGIVLSY